MTRTQKQLSVLVVLAAITTAIMFAAANVTPTPHQVQCVPKLDTYLYQPFMLNPCEAY